MNSVLGRICILALVACCTAIGGCFHPNIEDGGFSCDPTLVPACPSGFFCVEGRCRSSPSETGGGGGTAGDAGGTAGGGGTAGNGGGGGGDTGGGDLAMTMTGPADMSHAQAPPDLATGSSSNCAHDICTSGTKLTNGCDPCVTQICTQDSYCCVTKWSSQCVTEVGTICNQSCP